MNAPKTANYYAYLLRFWRGDDNTAWRATLEDPHSGQQLSFADMDALFAFLAEQAYQRPPTLPGRDC